MGTESAVGEAGEQISENAEKDPAGYVFGAHHFYRERLLGDGRVRRSGLHARGCTTRRSMLALRRTSRTSRPTARAVILSAHRRKPIGMRRVGAQRGESARNEGRT